MLRNILAAVLGYVVIVAIVLSGIGVAWMFVGGAGAFRGEGPEPSTIWMVLNVASGLVAAVAAGWTALKVGRSAAAVKILVGIVLAMGIWAAVASESNYAKREPVNKPVAEMGFREAGQHAKLPNWYNWVVPVIGAAGVLVGGRQRT